MKGEEGNGRETSKEGKKGKKNGRKSDTQNCPPYPTDRS
jgi:hypothetical protein